MTTIHKKIWPKYFDDVASGKKKFELRLADFTVSAGDTLVLEEWDPHTKQYTGRSTTVNATYVIKTKDLPFFDQHNVETYGYQVIQIEKEQQ